PGGSLPHRVNRPPRTPAVLAPESAQTLILGNAEGEFPTEGMVGDAGELAQGGVNVLGADPNALLAIPGQRLRIDGHQELLLVGGTDDAIPPDSPTEEHDRADRPVVLALAVVVSRGTAHLALDDDHQTVADLQLLGPAHQVADAGEELGD